MVSALFADRVLDLLVNLLWSVASYDICGKTNSAASEVQASVLTRSTQIIITIEAANNKSTHLASYLEKHAK